MTTGTTTNTLPLPRLESDAERLDRLELEIAELRRSLLTYAYSPYVHQRREPCLFDDLPPGVYGLVCPCPAHSVRC